MIFVVALQARQGLPALLENFVLPCEQLALEIFALPIVHERLIFARLVTSFDFDRHSRESPGWVIGDAYIAATPAPYNWHYRE